MPDPFLKMTGISKVYPGIKAVDDIGFSVSQGEVIGLVGENGAGKSTLMKILGGVVAPSAGTIELDGTEMPRLTVGGSMRGGIAFVHQELNLFENLTAAANIFIGREPLKGGPFRLIDERELNRLGRTAAEAARRGFFGGHAGRHAVARANAAGRDRQGAVAQGAPRHHGRADLEPDGVGDRAAAQDHRAAEGRRRLGHLHLAPPGRGRAMRRPRRRAARRQAGRRTRQGRDPCRDDDPPHDRARPEDALPSAGQAARRGDPGTGRGQDGLPAGAGRQPVGETRRNPRPCRPCRLGPHRTCAHHLRPRRAERRRDQDKGRPRRDRVAERRRSHKASIWCRRTASGPA